MFRILLLWSTVVLVASLDEREFDPQVAPPPIAVPRPFQMWRSFASHLRMVFSRFQQQPTAPPPVKTRMGTTTPQPDLQFYGALNPIYQNGNF